jgi:hypothetical protein
MVADTVNPTRVELDYAPEIRLGASAWVRPEIFQNSSASFERLSQAPSAILLANDSDKARGSVEMSDTQRKAAAPLAGQRGSS